MLILKRIKKGRLLHTLLGSKKGQATAEMAILGAVVMMLFAYLLQQGYTCNARQALEMYTFREALRLSRQGVHSNRPVGINLTVIRDVIIPSFFSGISRQRLMSSASVDFNPWIAYTPDETGDMSTRQLFQVGEKMIRQRRFFEVPPSQLRVTTNEEDDPEWMWTNSAIRDISAPDSKITAYDYITNTQETPTDKTITKDLLAEESAPIGIIFESEEKVERSYMDDDWTAPGDDDHILQVDATQVPGDIALDLIETVQKVKTTTTPY